MMSTVAPEPRVPCECCDGTGRRTLNRKEADTLARVTAEWQTTTEILWNLRGKLAQTALLYRLRTRGRACDCRCPADHHDHLGCRMCGSRCEVSYQDHGDREASEAREAWLTAELAAGNPLAAWIEGWRREDPPENQQRPGPVAGGDRIGP